MKIPESIHSPRARIGMDHPTPPGAVLLADCSYSMATEDNPNSSKRRIDHLAEVLAYVMTYERLQALICFQNMPFEIPMTGNIRIPEPNGGTALHLALNHVARMMPRPSKVIVLCDGAPDHAEAALQCAQSLRPMPIDAFFCGNDRDKPAMRFMAMLAAAGGPGGRTGKFDLANTQHVAKQIRALISGPRR